MLLGAVKANSYIANWHVCVVPGAFDVNVINPHPQYCTHISMFFLGKISKTKSSLHAVFSLSPLLFWPVWISFAIVREESPQLSVDSV